MLVRFLKSFTRCDIISNISSFSLILLNLNSCFPGSFNRKNKLTSFLSTSGKKTIQTLSVHFTCFGIPAEFSHFHLVYNEFDGLHPVC